ncbi:MAG: dihydrodipicolinate synthase family protein [Clostridiales bacterium]|nr:dihydrodipicolinate synthase family protein [Clostridiales bacterium]
MNSGFYTALGTPFDENGNFIAESFTKHIEDQICAGASGLLIMGSMGIEPYVKESEYIKVARTGAEAARGRCPIFIGVMDNSVSRIKDKIDSLSGLKIDGIVTTAPFYYAVNQNEIIRFFTLIAAYSGFPVYIYDLPEVTNIKVDVNIIDMLSKNNNIKGIKTGDIFTARVLTRKLARNDFSVFFSGLDVFDIAYKYGIMMNLDGMFVCTAPLATMMYANLKNGEYGKAAFYLDQILELRDIFVSVGVFSGFSYAMNLLGYEGRFSPDYCIELKEDQAERVMNCMKKINLI